MAPQSNDTQGEKYKSIEPTLSSQDHLDSEDAPSKEVLSSDEDSPPVKIVWKNVIMIGLGLHIAAVYGAYLMFTSAMWQTNLFAFILYPLSGIGMTAGAHRLWSHRTYKAKLPLRIFLAFLFTITFQNDIFMWCRNHRVHHKFSETNADPHNAKRGFFFSHIGWTMCRKHPDVTTKGQTIDVSDLLADPVVKFQRNSSVQISSLHFKMAPQSTGTQGENYKMIEPNLRSQDHLDSEDASSKEVLSSDEDSPPVKLLWKNVILYGFVLHISAVYGAYLMFTSAMCQTNLFAFILYPLSGIGVNAGVHRLWSHRTYKAKLPLRIFLAFLYTITVQDSIFVWSRDHRVHHKFSETNADPHNAKRGFFFSHIGWILCREHPDVITKGQTIDVSDLLADPVVMFQREYYRRLVALCCFVLPTIVPMYFWGETFINALLVVGVFRLVVTLHQTFLVNSVAHMWGQRPYDNTINPADNFLVNITVNGEGFHNFHHTFPYDYATSEYGIKYNLTTMFIDLMAWIGQAYDRKTVSREVILARKLRTGQEKEH